MNNDKNTSVLVIFNKELPKKNHKFWSRFDVAMAPMELESEIQKHGLVFINVEDLIEPGNVYEASELMRRLSIMTTPDGRRISKIVKEEGFELWWIHYDDLV